MVFFAFISLVLATVISINGEDYSRTLIPYAESVVPAVHFLCALVCLFLFFFPLSIVQAAVCIIEGVCTTMIGLEMLGLLLFSTALLILFCNQFFLTNKEGKIAAILIVWLLAVIGLFPFGTLRLLQNITITLFAIFLYRHLYNKLRNHLGYFVNAQKKISRIDILPTPGARLSLKSVGLTERQAAITMEYIHCRKSYEEIAEKLILSTSTVKKEMAAVNKLFEVKNSGELYLILVQYNLMP